MKAGKSAVEADILKQNLYLAHKSIRDEIPRLIKQGKLLFQAEREFMEHLAARLPGSKFLDIGSGTGLYLSLLAKVFSSYEMTGVDVSKSMLDYARLCFPSFNYVESSIYSMPFPDSEFDIAHASFLFIHLSEPVTGLREVARVLKPKGRLVVIDIDDSTFRGPRVINALVDAYDGVYEGNRKIMSKLESLASSLGFRMEQKRVFTVDNTGNDGELTCEKDRFHIGKMTLWGLLAYLAQREEVAAEYEAAQSYYMSRDCEIEVSIMNHVYVLDKK
ncbi:MAG: methyltransferase domain-containing protein [Spirochaetes bacterium]|nr:methyltransferase domain-containing protein [Spirochaetota bacterium]